MSLMPTIAILGRKKDTGNYEAFLKRNRLEPLTTMNPGKLISCGGLLLPGGGDIAPAFFGEQNRGSRNIDTELDILQFQALEYCLRYRLPVLGVCKGMQLINVALGGTVVQDMADSRPHYAPGRDLQHAVLTEPGNPLYDLCGRETLVNSAHHQCVGRIGNNLSIVQRCLQDGCPEALLHKTLPVLGLQWHPERLEEQAAKLSDALVQSFFEEGFSASP